MAHSTFALEPKIAPSLHRRPETAAEREHAPAGPWLVLTGPLVIALTVATVCWLSRISF